MKSIVAFIALATCAELVCGSASAQSVRISVGELSTPEAVLAFDHRLEAAAQRFCGSRYTLTDLSGRAACLKGVRDEALEQLTPAERETYADMRRAQIRSAAR